MAFPFKNDLCLADEAIAKTWDWIKDSDLFSVLSGALSTTCAQAQTFNKNVYIHRAHKKGN